MFDNAESSFRLRWRSSQILFRAERELREVIRRCATMPGRYQAEEHLKVVREELAESNLRIALFYLKKPFPQGLQDVTPHLRHVR
jgi:outer membrane protein assembly factor BamD (BamD/ComL family)